MRAATLLPTLTRRRLLQRIGSFGAGLVGTVGLAACGGGAAAPPTTASSSAVGTVAGSAGASKLATTAQPTAAAQASGAAQPVSVSTWGGADEVAVRKELLQAFNQQHSGANASLQVAPGGQPFYDKLQAAMAGGVPPDVFYMGPDNFPAFAGKQVLQPISPYMQRDKYDPSDFWPGPLSQYAAQGNQYGLPRGVASNVLYYNSDLFKKFGLPLPPTDWNDSSWNWQTFLDAGAKLSQAGGTTQSFAFAGLTGFYAWFMWVRQNGGTVLSSDFTTCTIADAKTQEALQYLHDLMYKYNVAPTPTDLKQQSAMARFQSGNLAMLSGIRAGLAGYQAIKGFTWDIAPYPKGAVRPATSLQGVGYCIAAGSKAKDNAWQVTQFMCSPTAETKEMATGTVMPARQSVGHSKDFLASPTHADVFLSAMDHAEVPPFNVHWQAIAPILDKELTNLWANTATVQVATQNIVSQVNAILQQPGS